MAKTTQEIQIHVLSKIADGGMYLRKDAAETLGVTGKAVDEAMARCSLVERITANGGRSIRYRMADFEQD